MRKLAIFCAGYAGSVFAATYFLPEGVLLPLGGFCVVLTVLLRLLKRILPDRNRRRALLCCAGMAVGLLWTWGYGALFLNPVRQLDDKTVSLTGTVLEFPLELDYGGRVLIRAQMQGGGSADTLLYLESGYPQLEPGDRVSVIAHCTLATHSDEGEEITYYTAKGIFLTAKVYGEVKWERPDRIPLSCIPAHLNQSLKQSIDRSFPEEAGSLVKAVVTGNRDNLSDSFTSSLQRTGLAHTVAVSGMHLAYLAGFLAAMLGRGSRRAAVVSLPLILLFTLVAGCTPSVVRAAVMIIMLQIAPLIGRERDGFTSLAFALLLLLLHNPFACAHVGLQMSFGAVAGILLCSEGLQKRMLKPFCLDPSEKSLLRRVWNGAVRVVVSVFATTIGALVFTTPLTAFYFGQVSLIAPLSNLFALWAVSAVFVGGIAVGLTGMVLPTAAQVLALPVTWVTRYLYWVISGLGRLSFASIPMDNIYYRLWLLFVYGLLILVLLIPGKKRPGICLLSLLVTLTVAVVCTNLSFHTGSMAIRVLDVGQGQSVLISSGTQLALVDCGGDHYENAGDIAADRIQSTGETQLDLLVVSHYHDDHANGIPELFHRVDIKELALPDVEGDSELRQEILSLAQAHGTRVRFIRKETTLSFGENGVFTIYPPLGNGEETNELGLTVLCSTGDYDVLLTGDMGVEGEETLVQSTQLPDVELMVAGHHGSKYSNSKLLLERVRPDVAVFSVGGDNHYGHPTPEAMERFRAVGAELYRTDWNGTVCITVEPD